MNQFQIDQARAAALAVIGLTLDHISAEKNPLGHVACQAALDHQFRTMGYPADSPVFGTASNRHTQERLGEVGGGGRPPRGGASTSKAKRARAFIAETIRDTGRPPTRWEVARRYDRSARWADDRLSEMRETA